MLRMNERALKEMEDQYPGITKQILRFENAVLPSCPHCASEDTADVQIGIIGRTIHITAATSKVKLIPNLPEPGKYFCNKCNKYFNPKVKKI